MSRTGSLVVALANKVGSTEIEERLFSQAGINLIKGECFNEEEVISLASDAHALMVTYAPVTERVINSLNKCTVIATYSTGTNHIDVPAAQKKGMKVFNVPGYCTEEVADHTMALILALARNLFPLNKAVREGWWSSGTGSREKYDALLGSIKRIRGQSIGIIGFGSIARAVAVRAQAFGLKVLAFDPFVKQEIFDEAQVESFSLNQLIPQVDFLSLHVPASPDSLMLLNRERIYSMKKGAFLINTARGDLIDEAALAEAISSGHLAGAGLDVLWGEPPEKDHPLRKFPNVIVTPHAAFYSQGSLDELHQRVAEAVVKTLKKGGEY